jgi:8-oxo-dGTP pyrophosphatase MutT (NUDIX family)
VCPSHPPRRPRQPITPCRLCPFRPVQTTHGNSRRALIWRHRFITDTWGWEVPAGWVEPGEDPEAAIRREIEEETGYHVGRLEPMISYNAISSISTMRFAAYVAVADQHGRIAPSDNSESAKVKWIRLVDVSALIHSGQIQDGPSLTALACYQWFAASKPPYPNRTEK